MNLEGLTLEEKYRHLCDAIRERNRQEGIVTAEDWWQAWNERMKQAKAAERERLARDFAAEGGTDRAQRATKSGREVA